MDLNIKKIVLNRIKILFLKFKGAKLGEGIKIYGRFRVQGDYKKLQIGDRCTINYGVFLGTRGGLKIGNDVRISPYAVLLSSGLNFDKNERIHFEKETIIENNVWIASNTTINAGIKIGENSVIASGAVVTKDVPPNSLAKGVPARVVKYK